MIALTSHPRRREDILKQRAAEDFVLFNLENGQYYALDEVGGRIWECCDGTCPVSEIISLLCQEYEAPAATIQADVIELLEDLAHENLVVLEP
ncbi:MAG TPA: PqqD family protein [Chthonomonadaceae bacterium]|nr:PqqD family protein [Chthonomonadaceae bacterium]